MASRSRCRRRKYAMVSTRKRIEPNGLFSSMSLKLKYGVPEHSTISSITE
jgi:hypothetical protein